MELLRITAEKVVTCLGPPVHWPTHWTGARSEPCRQVQCLRCQTSRARPNWLLPVGWDQRRWTLEIGATSWQDLAEMKRREDHPMGTVVRWSRKHSRAPLRGTYLDTVPVAQPSPIATTLEAIGVVYGLPPLKKEETKLDWLARILPAAHATDPDQLQLWEEGGAA